MTLWKVTFRHTTTRRLKPVTNDNVEDNEMTTAVTDVSKTAMLLDKRVKFVFIWTRYNKTCSHSVTQRTYDRLRYDTIKIFDSKIDRKPPVQSSMYRRCVWCGECRYRGLRPHAAFAARPVVTVAVRRAWKVSDAREQRPSPRWHQRPKDARHAGQRNDRQESRCRIQG